MSAVDAHRRVPSASPEVHDLTQPFSSFDFVEDHFDGPESVRRIFSLARAANAKSLVLEQIEPLGLIAEEMADISALYPSYQCQGLVRLSFWAAAYDGSGTTPPSESLLGYAILKKDVVAEKVVDRSPWHVFEAVFRKFDHPHNCVPRPQIYRLTVLGEEHQVGGVLYAQQNQLNKACAQVALRSLLSRLLPSADVSYREINAIAAAAGSPAFLPAQGLSVRQIQRVLQTMGVGFNDIDYRQMDPDFRKDMPYQKYAYSGVESGGGALLGFRLAGTDLEGEKDPPAHIIPVYGHTFNKDTWAPDADMIYFHVGENFGYVPSESWTSSFLAHDDNFGPNFCIPRLFIDRQHADYVAELFRSGIRSSGMKAEVQALDILYSIRPGVHEIAGNGRWLRRLLQWTDSQRIVLRSHAMTRQEYVDHLRSLRDWEGNTEAPDLCTALEKEMPQIVWLVEVSTPQLFPANERKLGEIVLDATKEINLNGNGPQYDNFEFARLPGLYVFGGMVTNDVPQFTMVKSKVLSHTDLSKFSR